MFNRRRNKTIKSLERFPERLLVLLDSQDKSEGVAAFQFLL